MSTDMTDWPWWASSDGEIFRIGPCDTREDVIAEALHDELGQNEDGSHSFVIVQAKQDPIKLSAWLDVEEALNRADESLADSDRTSAEFDDYPIFDCSKDQEEDLKRRIAAACDAWQEERGLEFRANTFSHCGPHETVTILAEDAERIIASTTVPAKEE